MQIGLQTHVKEDIEEVVHVDDRAVKKYVISLATRAQLGKELQNQLTSAVDTLDERDRREVAGFAQLEPANKWVRNPWLTPPEVGASQTRRGYPTLCLWETIYVFLCEAQTVALPSHLGGVVRGAYELISTSQHKFGLYCNVDLVCNHCKPTCPVVITISHTCCHA